ALAFAQHWHTKNGPSALPAGQSLCFWKLGAFSGERVVQMYGDLVDHRAAGDPIPVNRQFFNAKRYRTVMRAVTQVVAFSQMHNSVMCLAKLAGAVSNGLENRPNISRRGRNHFQDIAGPGLVSQRL